MALHRRTVLGVLSSAVAIGAGCTERQPTQGCTDTPDEDAMDDLTIGNQAGEAAHLRVEISRLTETEDSNELVFEFERNLVGDTSRTFRDGIFTETGKFAVTAWTDTGADSREFMFNSTDSLNRYHVSIGIADDGSPRISSSHIDGC